MMKTDLATIMSEDEAQLAFFHAMVMEAARSQARHDPYHSLHEMLGVLLEEVHEVQEEVFKRTHDRDRANLLREMMQVASIMMRGAYELGMFAGYTDLTDQALQRAFHGDHGTTVTEAS